MKYCISTDGERYEGEYDTEADALAEAFEDYDYESVTLGTTEGKAKISSYLTKWCIEAMLENIIANAGDECGEISEEFLSDVSKDQLEELVGPVGKLLEEWADKHKLQPAFYSVKELRVVTWEDYEKIKEGKP